MSASSGRETDWDRLFDELYLKTYANQRDEDAAPLALGAMRLAGREAPADVLDAACGYGRHSRALAAAGHRVVGFDRSGALLAEARRRSEADGWPEWIRGDYRKLPFSAASFDVVVNLFTSFGFYGDEDDAQVLAEFRRVLRPGGTLVLETMHRDRLVSILRTDSWEELPDEAARLERRDFDPVEGILQVELTYWPRGEDPVTVEYRLRVYTATELVHAARAAGFPAVEVHGDVDRGPLTRETRLVLVARAPS